MESGRRIKWPEMDPLGSSAMDAIPSISSPLPSPFDPISLALARSRSRPLRCPVHQGKFRARNFRGVQYSGSLVDERCCRILDFKCFAN